MRGKDVIHHPYSKYDGVMGWGHLYFLVSKLMDSHLGLTQFPLLMFEMYNSNLKGFSFFDF